MATDLKTLMHDPAYYDKSFGAWKARYPPNLRENWVQTEFPKRVVNKISVVTGPDKELKILGVGSGTGEFDHHMISQLIKKFPRISNTVAEPSADAVEKYKSLMSTKTIPGVRSDFHVMGTDGILSLANLETVKFDFISAVHSLYYVDDLEKTLMKLVNRLNNGGVMYIVMLAGSSGLFRLWTKFPEFADAKMSYISSDNIKNVLTKNKVTYDVVKFPHHTDITCCFSGQNENDADLIWDFLSHTTHFRKSAPPDKVEAFTTFVTSECMDERKDDTHWFNNDWEYAIVYKN